LRRLEAVLPGMSAHLGDGREKLDQELAPALLGKARADADVHEEIAVVEPEQERADSRCIERGTKAAHHAVGGLIELDLATSAIACLVASAPLLGDDAVDVAAHFQPGARRLG